MPSVEELRNQIERLKRKEAENISRLDQEKKLFLRKKQEAIEKKKLEKELRDLQSPKASAIKRNLFKAGKLAFKAIVLIGDDIDRRVKESIKQKKIIREKEIEMMKLKAQRKAQRKSKTKKPSKRRPTSSRKIRRSKK